MHGNRRSLGLTGAPITQAQNLIFLHKIYRWVLKTVPITCLPKVIIILESSFLGLYTPVAIDTVYPMVNRCNCAIARLRNSQACACFFCPFTPHDQSTTQLHLCVFPPGRSRKGLRFICAVVLVTASYSCALHKQWAIASSPRSRRLSERIGGDG